ncbi:MAG: hypothetical protein ABSD47_09850 [Candidatus Methylomirabilota bacterium]|jgi:hypothetical protein
MGIDPITPFNEGLKYDILLLDLTLRAIAGWERQALKFQSAATATRGRRLLQDLRERRMSLADPWKRRRMTADEIKTADKLVFEIDDILPSLREKVEAPNLAGTNEAELAVVADVLNKVTEGFRGILTADETAAKAGTSATSSEKSLKPGPGAARPGGDRALSRGGGNRRGGTPMGSHNIHDQLGTFKGKRIGSIYDGGGAAGRALLDDIRAVTQNAQSLRNAALATADRAKAADCVTRLRKALDGTRDPAARGELERMTRDLTKKYDLGGGPTSPAGTDSAWFLGQLRAQARDIANALDAMIDTTIDNRTREDLGRLSGQVRLQYGLTAEDTGPGSPVPSQARTDQAARTDQRRQQGREVAATLDRLAAGTDDPALREALEGMAQRAWATFGRPRTGQ